MTVDMSKLEIGTAVYHPATHQTGYVSKVSEPESCIYALGGATGMTMTRHELEIVWPDHVNTAPDSIARTWLDCAARSQIAPITAEQVTARKAAALKAMAAARDQAAIERDAATAKATAFLVEAESRMPADAKAVICGELIEDRSDTMTDYYASTTVRTIILGFSTHTRDLFPELRKAARNHPETAHLADAPPDAEHREKYSMGGGYFLKHGGRNANGWRIKKHSLYHGARSIPVGEWATVTPATATPAPTTATGNGATRIEKHVHTKHGFDIWIVCLAERVERDEFDRLRDAAKAAGGWYSRPWGKTPGGFAFKVEDDAVAFAGTISGPATAAATTTTSGTAARLRSLADGLQGAIDSAFRDRLENTPKRQREGQKARLEGERLKRTQEALRLLADRHESGTVPPELARATTKAAVYDLCRAEINTGGSYYDAGYETGKPGNTSPAALTLWAMLRGPSEADRAAEALRVKIGGLQFANIPGYFPTPAPIVARMIEAANIPAGGCTVLEPSAGSGSILDALPAGCVPVIYERHVTLREILKAKGYTLTGADFTESAPNIRVARVLMNPPFENGQDITHIMRAFDHLDYGGRLVAIMSPGPFYRSDAKATAFRAWFEANNGQRENLPAGAFKESGTGVATVLVTIDRD